MMKRVLAVGAALLMPLGAGWVWARRAGRT